MTTEKIARPRRSLHRNPTSCGDAPNEIERLHFSKSPTAGQITNGSLGSVDAAPLHTLLDAVDDQRIKLVNVLGIVHSMGASFTATAEDSAPEICAAFDLLEQEIQCVVVGLKQVSFRDPT